MVNQIIIKDLNPEDVVQLKTDGMINDTQPLSTTAEQIVLQRDTGE